MITILGGCANTDTLPESFDSVKIVARDQIPNEIWNGLGGIGSLELTRGSYYFLGREYGVEGNYLLLCGGDAYRDGYDAEIVSMTYHVSASASNEVTHHPVITRISQITDGYFDPIVREISTDTGYDYCEDSTYPFVIFRIDAKVCDTDKIARDVFTTEPEVFLFNQQGY